MQWLCLHFDKLQIHFAQQITEKKTLLEECLVIAFSHRLAEAKSWCMTQPVNMQWLYARRALSFVSV